MAFDQLFCGVAGDLDGFRNRPSQSDRALKVIGGREVNAIGEFFDL